VTGSNAVNVFLGLGISWTMGAAYWAATPAPAEWIARYPAIALKYGVTLGGPLPGMAVEAGDLGFSGTKRERGGYMYIYIYIHIYIYKVRRHARRPAARHGGRGGRPRILRY